MIIDINYTSKHFNFMEEIKFRYQDQNPIEKTMSW